MTPPTHQQRVPPAIAPISPRDPAPAKRLCCFAALLLCCFSAGCSKPPPPPPPPAPVPVTTAVAHKQDVPITLRSVGNVQSIAEVTLRPQVAGQVLDTPSGEGVDVKSGDVVVRIDPRPFQATLQEAQAALDRQQTLAQDAHRAAESWRNALANKATSEREAQAAEAQAAAADAQVAQDRAAVETAKLNLEYCTIRAPFDGRLGALLVKPGAVVKENETDLVTITQIAPIDVAFALPEQRLESIRTAVAKGTVPAQAMIPGDQNPAAGELTFIDNKVDAATGTVRLKARFPNADRRLWPGQFVNITITVGVENGALVVPSSAVQASQKGQAVFIVKPDQTVEMRPVTADVLDGNTVVRTGLSAGETVVTEGQLRLVPGAKVAPKNESPAPAAAGNAK